MPRLIGIVRGPDSYQMQTVIIGPSPTESSSGAGADVAQGSGGSIAAIKLPGEHLAAGESAMAGAGSTGIEMNSVGSPEVSKEGRATAVAAATSSVGLPAAGERMDRLHIGQTALTFSQENEHVAW
mmetsp:Transcript_36225/g.103522  ORF Transcript_36225/g.103522 Transcript_36225/m.103522 type:complete len:126 (+) Transcript_36225:731-1108(+)